MLRRLSSLRRLVACTGLVLLAMVPTTQAERIGLTYQAADTTIERPRAGQSMATVENRFGSPTASRGPVGQPPITIWDYPAFTVYFEGNLVIHTVLKPAR